MAWSSPTALGGPPTYRFCVTRVFHVLVRVCRTSKMTVYSPPALVVSRTSFSLLGLIGIGLWHRSRLPRVAERLPEHHAPYAVVSTGGLLRRRSAALAASRGYYVFRLDVEHRLTPCRVAVTCGRRIHVCLPSFADCQRGSAAPASGCMVHASLGEYDTLRPCAVSADDV